MQFPSKKEKYLGRPYLLINVLRRRIEAVVNHKQLVPNTFNITVKVHIQNCCSFTKPVAQQRLDPPCVPVFLFYLYRTLPQGAYLINMGLLHTNKKKHLHSSWKLEKPLKCRIFFLQFKYNGFKFFSEKKFCNYFFSICVYIGSAIK